ncbi:MAG: NAD(P)-dependent oxidoreductase [Actinomycetota bacterium]|nr:NAD(P)-dependent oxidoreductase [Actinomycetota bacterium]
MSRILVTGSAGLIGSALVPALRLSGMDVVTFDRAEPGCSRNVTDAGSVRAAAAGCSGIVHLAAASRVARGEQDPARCRLVNVTGTRNVLAAAHACAPQPWVLFASTREVYGKQAVFPVPESAAVAPLNVYARSKVDGESLVMASRQAGLRASIVRFSNVYGSVTDHPDRVAPAFARAAAEGAALCVNGSGTVLDFTHLEDVTAALARTVGMLSAGEGLLPTIHLASGHGTTLTELAHTAIRLGGAGRITHASRKEYEVDKFIGDPALAEQILGWRAAIPVEDGMARLIESFRLLEPAETS